MRFAKLGIAALAIMLLAVAVPSNAAEKLVYKQGIFGKVTSGGNFWVNCGYVTITPPADGVVVVTVSGMALFDSTLSDLSLTINTVSAKRGPWVFGVTPGYQLVQNYSIRRVFTVQANKTTKFYLNGSSLNGPGRKIQIQTGSITAEFFDSSDAQQLSAPAVLQTEKSDDARSNE